MSIEKDAECLQACIDYLAKRMTARSDEIINDIAEHWRDNHGRQDMIAIQQALIAYTAALAIHTQDLFREMVEGSEDKIDPKVLLACVVNVITAANAGIAEARENLAADRAQDSLDRIVASQTKH